MPRAALIALVLASLVVETLAAVPFAPTGFTFQGRVRVDGVLANGLYDITARLYDVDTGGSALDTIVIPADPAHPIANGLFSVFLDFDPALFNGAALWLELEFDDVDPKIGPVTLSPRQPIDSAPYALHALSGGEWQIDMNGNLIFGDGLSAIPVGINTIDPQTTLHAVGPLRVDRSTDTPDQYIELDANSSANIIRGVSSGGKNLRFENASHINFTAGPDLFNRMHISGDGGVGIGNFDPDGILHLGQLADEASAGLTINNLNNTATLRLWVDGADNPRIDGGTTGNGRVIVNGEGNGHLGIGTLTPGAPLSIKSSESVKIALERDGVTEDWGVHMDANSVFFVHDGQTTALRIYENGDIHAAHDITAGNLCCGSSDQRLKHHVAPRTGCLDDILRLRPVNFDWNPAAFPDGVPSDAHQVGFIAQDVRDVVPEVVIEGRNGMLAMDYGRLTPLLSGAVAELHAEVEQLNVMIESKDAQLRELEHLAHDQSALINELASRLEAIEARLAQNAAGSE